MTQSFTAAPARPAAEAPEIFSVLRRYIWLMVLGTLVGTTVGASLYIYLRKTQPRYTATNAFQVLPQQRSPTGMGQVENYVSSQEEVARFVKRQIKYIMDDAVLSEVLKSDKFTRDWREPNSNKPSPWLSEGTGSPKKRLKKDIDVSSDPTANLFAISFTARDAEEAKVLADAVADVYITVLRDEGRINNSKKLQDLNEVVERQQKEVANLEEQLAAFRKTRDIDAIQPRRELQVRVLEALNTKVFEAQSRMVALKSMFESIKKQVEAGTFTLPSEAELQIVNDPQIRQLDSILLGLNQELAVVIRQTGPMGENAKNLQTRIDTVKQQTAERREKLTADAKARYQSDAEAAFNAAAEQYNRAEEERKQKDNEIRDMDIYLVQAARKQEELRDQKDILSGLRKTFRDEDLKKNTDDTRIQRFGRGAVVPEEPSWPIWYKWWVPAGFIIGLGLSFSAAYLFELTNTRIRTPSDITRALQLPLLGFIPDQQDDTALTGELSTSVRTAPNSMIAESFRQIRGRLIAQADGNPLKSVLVASIAPGGGATTVASNIANAMALNELKVLLVDANFYRPGLPKIYKNLPSVGLADLVAKTTTLANAIIQSDSMPNLSVMGTGHLERGTAAEMMESRNFRELLEQLKTRFDLIVFDSAPLSLVSDSITLGGRVDGVIPVVRAGEVHRGTVARVREQLKQVRARILGMVLNAAQTHGAGYFKKNYRVFYEYAGRGTNRNTPASVN